MAGFESNKSNFESFPANFESIPSKLESIITSFEMTLDDLTSFFNATPVSEVTSAGEHVGLKVDFNDAFVDSLVEFLFERKYVAAMIAQDRPILASQSEGIVAVSERPVLSFEMDDLFQLLITAEVQNDLGLAGKAEREDVMTTSTGQQISFKVIVSYEPGYPKAIYLHVLGTDAVDEFNIDRDLGSPFAAKHDGSMFHYEGFMIEKTFDDMLRWTTNQKASDITVQPGRPVFARIGSEYLPVTEIPLNTDEIDKIVRHIYGPSGPAEILGGAALDPAHEVFVKRVGRIRYRVNITGGRYKGTTSAEISLRTLPTIPIKLSELDIELELARAAVGSHDGLVLFTGATGSGKSTLMSSIIRDVMENATAETKIVEFSAPIEFIYDGVIAPHATIWQTTAGKELIDPNGGSIFAAAVSNAMRRNPDIIIIGESRDTDTMQNTISASMSGHLVMSTMHTKTVDSTIRRAVNMFDASVRQQMSIDIMEQLRLICTQRLIPRVGGGRVAVREFMVFGEEIRETFLRQDVDKWPRLVRSLLAEEKAIGQSMAKGAMKLLRAGKITEETYEKVASKSKGI
jgi:defect-in-organelle-trafficking protein DotB